MRERNARASRLVRNARCVANVPAIVSAHLQCVRWCALCGVWESCVEQLADVQRKVTMVDGNCWRTFAHFAHISSIRNIRHETVPQDAAAFREFLLVKLINGEKATFQTPTFARKRERTLEMLIKDLYEENVHDGKSVSLRKREAVSIAVVVIA